MRIVGGSAKGRTLATPKSDDVTRPTADRVRETLFNVLGQTCDDLEVLDLFAGTGALGLEAVSRGATKAVLVDRNREAVQLCRDNVKALKFDDRVEVIAGDVFPTLESFARTGRAFQLVFSDPPYALNAGVKVLEALNGLVTEGGIAVIETGRDEELPERVGHFERIDARTYGATVVSIFRLTHHDA
ncbi:MAG: 16S rRNA (guanine(966)-N(2))-methyltransferase RsmD [Archangium sp.]